MPNIFNRCVLFCPAFGTIGLRHFSHFRATFLKAKKTGYLEIYSYSDNLIASNQLMTYTVLYFKLFLYQPSRTSRRRVKIPYILTGFASGPNYLFEGLRAVDPVHIQFPNLGRLFWAKRDEIITCLSFLPFLRPDS